jgi:hypothetical protein
VKRYAEDSEKRLAGLRMKEESWWSGERQFFDVPRSRAWVMTRRIAHSAHHRGQQMAMLRMFGYALHSNYGPDGRFRRADTKLCDNLRVTKSYVAACGRVIGRRKVFAAGSERQTCHRRATAKVISPARIIDLPGSGQHPRDNSGGLFRLRDYAAGDACRSSSRGSIGNGVNNDSSPTVAEHRIVTAP